ncbi:DsbA family protein [Yunchengibacter salinarum]|uniref:DsbA family protein n=1 Tax=Yunchengibacter salinarum TaxID=3133399 RepID=UPI0035B5A9FE
MSFATAIKARLVAAHVSARRDRWRARRADWRRRLARKPREVIYFHRVDDPVSQLMVQVLPELADRFDVRIRPRVVERLPAQMYPDPARYEALTIIDATRLAQLYGLGFPGHALVPDRLAVGMATRHLAALETDPAFFDVAQEVGGALWRQDMAAVKALAVQADMAESRLRENESLLRRLGHYQSGTLYHQGVFYPGLDRLDHLERDLNWLGAGDGQVRFNQTRRWREKLEGSPRTFPGRTVELFFSPRSPYSYLGLEQIVEFAERTGVKLRLRPVLPMVMRGLKVPPLKARYILMDAAREARLEDIPFGRIVDPLGTATERALSIGFKLMDTDEALPFFRRFMAAVWSEGVDGAEEKGMMKILRGAGLPERYVRGGLPGDDWRALAAENQSAMLRAGSWGVPTFRVDDRVFWGQDRLWAILDHLDHSQKLS